MSIAAELGQYILQTQCKKILNIEWRGEFDTPVGLPKTTARVDSRLKLTFGELFSKSTHHVWQVDYLVVG